MKYIISQGFGVVGVICFILSFQIKSNKKLFIMQIFANLMFVVQFILLEAYSGCGGLVLCIIRNVLVLQRKKWKWASSWYTCGILIGICLINTLYGWEGWYSLFAFGAVASSTIGYWKNNPLAVRTSNLFFASPCWIIYDSAVSAWAGVLNELIAMASILISVYRFGWKKLESSGKEFTD